MRAAAHSASDLADKARAAARILDSVGERLGAGDLVITGSIVQVPLAPGDEVEADLGVLGRMQPRIAKS